MVASTPVLSETFDYAPSGAAKAPFITQLLVDWSRGNDAALAELTPYVHRELHALARGYLGRGRANPTLQPTALINETYLRLIGKPVQWENRSHFFGIAARLMRLILVDHARAYRAAKRGGGLGPVTLQEATAFAPSQPLDVVEVDEALIRAVDPAVDMEAVRTNLAVIPLVCKGGPEAGPIGALPTRGRFRWLVSPRSTIIQPSEVHTGRTTDPAACLEHLMTRVVRRGT